MTEVSDAFNFNIYGLITSVPWIWRKQLICRQVPIDVFNKENHKFVNIYIACLFEAGMGEFGM